MEKWSLTALADGLLSHALDASDRRGVRTVCDGRSGPLHQTVIAVAHGQRLEQHDDPGEATVQVLRGRVRVTAGDDTTEGSPGELLVMPGGRRTVVALEDTVLLLTAADRTTPIAAGWTGVKTAQTPRQDVSGRGGDLRGVVLAGGR